MGEHTELDKKKIARHIDRFKSEDTKKIEALTAERDLLKKMVGLGANEILLGRKKYSKILGERNALLKKYDLVMKALVNQLKDNLCIDNEYASEQLCRYDKNFECGSPECIELHIKQAGEEK